MKVSRKEKEAEDKASNQTTTSATSPSTEKVLLAGNDYEKKPCHEEPKEVYPGLFLGSWRAAKTMAEQGVDVLVPLADLEGKIWRTGWRGRILYYPIEDYEALPEDVLARFVDEVLDALAQGESVGIFCMGGHGRTGYAAAAVLGKLLPQEDPIAYLRRVYCEKAVESQEQIDSLADFLAREDLREHAPAKQHYVFHWGYWARGYDDELDVSAAYAVPTSCRDCHYSSGKKEVVCALDPGREKRVSAGACSLAITKEAAKGLSPLCEGCVYWNPWRNRCDIYRVKGNVVDCTLFSPIGNCD